MICEISVSAMYARKCVGIAQPLSTKRAAILAKHVVRDLIAIYRLWQLVRSPLSSS